MGSVCCRSTWRRARSICTWWRSTARWSPLCARHSIRFPTPRCIWPMPCASTSPRSIHPPGRWSPTCPMAWPRRCCCARSRSWPEVTLWLAMVQREVGERLAAAPGRKAYGATSVLAQLACDVRVLRRVPRTVFHPEPNVESALDRAAPHRARSRAGVRRWCTPRSPTGARRWRGRWRWPRAPPRGCARRLARRS